MKSILSALAAAVLLPAFGSSAAWSDTAFDERFDEAALYEKAKQEGELTWYVGQYGTELAEQVAAGFSTQYPGIKVNVIRAGGQVLYARLMQDFQAGVAQSDVFGATETGHLVAMKAAGQLQQFQTANDADLYPMLQKADPDHYFVTTQNSDIVMIYNTNLVSQDQAPTSWEDLADPQWKGKISLGHPGFSGSSATWLSAMTLLYGDDFVERLGANDPHIGRSMGDPAVTLAAGERALGLTVISWAVNAARKGEPLAYIIPKEGALRNSNNTGIPANAPHPNAARLFINYLQSPDASRLVAEEFGYSVINSKAKRPDDLPDLATTDVIALDEAALATRTLEIVDIWRDVFGG